MLLFNYNGNRTILANGISTFLVNGKLVLINRPKTLVRNPLSWLLIFEVVPFNNISVFSRNLITFIISFISLIRKYLVGEIQNLVMNHEVELCCKFGVIRTMLKTSNFKATHKVLVKAYKIVLRNFKKIHLSFYTFFMQILMVSFSGIFGNKDSTSRLAMYKLGSY